MAKTSSPGTTLALPEEWIVQALERIEISHAPRQVLVRVRNRRICLNVVAGDGSEETWSHYSTAAARRASATGDRLRPVAATGHMGLRCFVAYEIGDARAVYPDGELTALSSARVVQLLHGIGRGLDQAAAAGFFPTELTPGSVFVDSSRGAVLADLGVAREALGNPPARDDRHAAWVAPEVLKGEEAAERSVVYSFGALLYTLLTGAPPHEGSPEEIVKADPPSIRRLRPDLPEALEVVISTAMARDPRRRYRTAAETRSLANILLQGDLVPTPTPEPKPRRRTPVAAHAPKPTAGSPRTAPLRRRSQGAVETGKRRISQAASATAEAFEAAKRRTSRAASATAHGFKTAKRRVSESASAKADAAPRPRGDVVPAAIRALRERTPSRLRALPGLPLALGGGVLVAGAVAGVLLAGPGAEEPPAPHTFTRSGLQVRLPGDWTGTVPAAGALAAHPADDRGSGLSLELVDQPVEREEQGNPVRLGRLEAWREPGAEVAGARAAVRYVIPTESGKLVATCRASARAATGTLSTCERVASTLTLRSATGLPIAAVVEQQERWQGEVARLGKERAAARGSLARAELPAGQRLAAEALERVHLRAATRFAALPGGEAVAAAARRTAASYRELAGVAGGESAQRWNAARARVRRSETSLRLALAES
jgi:Protein tyrosine and serine/threonine kinase